MTPCNEIGRTIQPARGPLTLSPTAAGLEPLRVVSMFAGIGGFDLGLERAEDAPTVAERLARIERELDAIRREAA